MTEREWIDLGKKRIKSILGTYTACSRLQLEMKISEAGPFNQRVEPVLLKDSCKELRQAGIVRSQQQIVQDHNPIEFFYLAGADGFQVSSRISQITPIHTAYDDITKNNQWCGNVLEYIIQKAIKASGEYSFIASVFEDTPEGINIVKNNEIISHNGHLLPNKTSLDILAFHKASGITIGIEVKNKRGWKYGDDPEIWQCINKCTTLEVLPVLVHRKIPDLAQFMFSKIGMLGMESQFQYFHPCKQEEMTEMIDKTLLGYSDIKFSVDPPAYMVNYFRTVIPKNIERYYDTFMEKKDLLQHYCEDRCLANDGFKGSYRYKAYEDLKKEIFD